jgi:hypothetical protein
MVGWVVGWGALEMCRVVSSFQDAKPKSGCEGSGSGVDLLRIFCPDFCVKVFQTLLPLSSFLIQTTNQSVDLSRLLSLNPSIPPGYIRPS